MRPDFWLFNIDVPMLTKMNTYCSCPAVYVRRYQQYILLYSKFNEKDQIQSLKDINHVTFQCISNTYCKSIPSIKHLYTSLWLNGTKTGTQNHVTVTFLYQKVGIS